MELETEILFRNGDLQSKCFHSFRDMKQKQEFCDITLRIGNTAISAHRIVIAANIPFFRQYFLNARDESEEEEAALSTMDSSTLKYFIEYAYSCEMKISMTNATDLLCAAYHLGVDEVQQACCDFLSDRLQPENVIGLWNLACNLCCTSLLESTNCYIRENFVHVSQTKSFLNMSFPYVKELIGRDDLLAPKEEKVFEALMKWIKEYPEERKDKLPELLRRVRMPLLQLEYLTNTVCTEELIRNSIPCRDLLDEAKDCYLFSNRKSSNHSFSSQPRCAGRQVETSDVKEKTRICNLTSFTTYRVECYEDNNKEWRTVYAAESDWKGGAFATLDNEMYFFRSDTSLQYSLGKDKLTNLSKMPTSRFFAAAAPLRGKVIVCGGSIGDSVALNIVESFDPQKNEWTTLNPLRKHRAGPTAVALGDHIYVLGGTDYTSVHDTVERYDSHSGRWNIVSQMLTKRCIAGAATINGKIYVCGGDASPTAGVLKSLATAEVYDPSENSWRYISSMKTARHEVIVLPIRRKLYALGGCDIQSNCLSVVEIYDPEIDKWEFGPSPLDSHFLAGAVAMQ